MVKTTSSLLRLYLLRHIILARGAGLHETPILPWHTCITMTHPCYHDTPVLPWHTCITMTHLYYQTHLYYRETPVLPWHTCVTHLYYHDTLVLPWHTGITMTHMYYHGTPVLPWHTCITHLYYTQYSPAVPDYTKHLQWQIILATTCIWHTSITTTNLCHQPKLLI